MAVANFACDLRCRAADSMKTKLAIIEEKAAKLQSGWNASQLAGRKGGLGDASGERSTSRSVSGPVKTSEAVSDKVLTLQRIVREKNAEIQDLQVRCCV